MDDRLTETHDSNFTFKWTVIILEVHILQLHFNSMMNEVICNLMKNVFGSVKMCRVQAVSYHSMILLCARMTDVSMSMGWYLIPRSSMASSRDPTTKRASCLSVQTTETQNLSCCWRRTVWEQTWFDVEMKDTESKVTSVGVCELGATEEAQVASPGPDSLSVSKTESGVEVIGLENLLTITAVVTTTIVSAVHPNLHDRVKGLSQRYLNPNLDYGAWNFKQLKTGKRSTYVSAEPVISKRNKVSKGKDQSET